MTAEPKTLYLIDGHAQFFRAYHAIRTAMTSPVTKEPTNMTYGFMAMLLKVLRDYRPDYLAVVIDVSGDRESFRSAIFPEYKANRDAAPDDFGPQVERCLRLLEEMNVPVLGVSGVEADDVLATIVRRLHAEQPDLRIRLVSRDKDLAQLLSDGIELFDVHKDQSVTAADIFKTEGVKPEHVVDILALMGDTVDNVPGVPGIGPKTAGKLILEYGSIDNLLAHLDEIKGKRRENLERSRDALPLSRSLVELKDDVDVAFDLEQTRVDPEALPVERLLAAFRELGFTQHAKTLRKLTGGSNGADAASPPVVAAGDEHAGGLFGAGAAPDTPPRITGSYKAVTTETELATLVDAIQLAGTCAIQMLIDDRLPMRGRPCGVALAITPETAWYVPLRSPETAPHLDEEAALAHLRPMLEDESVAKIGHDLKRDVIVLRRCGVDLRGALLDTMIASYVIDATRSSHALDVLTLSLLGCELTSLGELLGRGRDRRRFDEVPLDVALAYAAQRMDAVLRLRERLAARLDEVGLRGLFDDVEMPLVRVLAELEFNGIRVDPDELDRQRARLGARIDELRASIADAAPSPFNPDSPKQLAAILFNQPDDELPGLGLKVIKRGKTGPSTDVEVLERLAGDPDVASPMPGLLIEYRQLTKLVSTYLVALKEAISPDTGRVHASFNQTGAATGRLSSSDPNLQNIPIRTEVGREIRRAFVAEPGHVLITADYSQVELRLLAHLADDPALIAAFDEGLDIHTAVAADVFGVAPQDVTPRQRGTAKMVNFGIVYGITAFGLARRLGPDVSVADAKQIIADYKQRYDRIDAFLAECVAHAVTNGYVETILKRRRDIPQVQARHPVQRALGERMAINTVVQGSAADLIKVAMVDLYDVLPRTHPDARLLLQIHDELVLEAPEDAADAVQGFVVERMEAAMDLKVPLEVDAKYATCWIE